MATADLDPHPCPALEPSAVLWKGLMVDVHEKQLMTVTGNQHGERCN